MVHTYLFPLTNNDVADTSRIKESTADCRDANSDQAILQLNMLNVISSLHGICDECVYVVDGWCGGGWEWYCDFIRGLEYVFECLYVFELLFGLIFNFVLKLLLKLLLLLLPKFILYEDELLLLCV